MHRRRCCWHIYRDSSRPAQSRRTGRIEAENGLYREAPAGGPLVAQGAALLWLPKPRAYCRVLGAPREVSLSLSGADHVWATLSKGWEILRNCCIACRAPSAVRLPASSDSGSSTVGDLPFSGRGLPLSTNGPKSSTSAAGVDAALVHPGRAVQTRHGLTSGFRCAAGTAKCAARTAGPAFPWESHVFLAEPAPSPQ